MAWALINIIREANTMLSEAPDLSIARNMTGLAPEDSTYVPPNLKAQMAKLKDFEKVEDVCDYANALDTQHAISKYNSNWVSSFVWDRIAEFAETLVDSMQVEPRRLQIAEHEKRRIILDRFVKRTYERTGTTQTRLQIESKFMCPAILRGRNYAAMVLFRNSAVDAAYHKLSKREWKENMSVWGQLCETVVGQIDARVKEHRSSNFNANTLEKLYRDDPSRFGLGGLNRTEPRWHPYSSRWSSNTNALGWDQDFETLTQPQYVDTMKALAQLGYRGNKSQDKSRYIMPCPLPSDSTNETFVASVEALSYRHFLGVVSGIVHYENGTRGFTEPDKAYTEGPNRIMLEMVNCPLFPVVARTQAEEGNVVLGWEGIQGSFNPTSAVVSRIRDGAQSYLRDQAHLHRRAIEVALINLLCDAGIDQAKRTISLSC